MLFFSPVGVLSIVYFSVRNKTAVTCYRWEVQQKTRPDPRPKEGKWGSWHLTNPLIAL